MTESSTLPAPLRRDVRKLGNLLGEVLKAQAGVDVFQRVEQIRSLSKRARAGDAEAGEALERALKELPSGEALPVARAFSLFLTLANIAETHHRLRSPTNSSGVVGGAGEFRETLQALANRGIDKERLFDSFRKLEIELVLTAHPTQVVRRSLLQRYSAVADALASRDRAADGAAAFDETLLREITTIWDTDEVMRDRPTPLDEVRGGLNFLEQALWHAVPVYLRRVDAALREVTGHRLPLDACFFRFGSWMGGDRDGNPNVTPHITVGAVRLGRWMAADLFSNEVERLRIELPMRSCNAELRERVGDTREPYRVLLRGVRDRLINTRACMQALIDGRAPNRKAIYETKQQLMQDLLCCYQSLCDVGQEVVAQGRLLDLIRRLECFGLTMVRVDLRQESDRHTQAMDAITRYLDLGSYAEWDEDKRLEFLVTELESKRPLIPSELPMSPDVEDVVETFRVAKTLGPEPLGAYVISMAKQASDVLCVELLQKAVGNGSPQRVVPLFETITDLRNAAEVMDRLFSIPWYRRRIGERQEIMIGYSDSAKDGGRLAANWGLYQAQEEVVAVCAKHGVEPTLFHGRGGTVARGGGPTHLAIQSQPPGSIAGRLRVTEQGEMIQAKFGTPGMAERSLETYAAATLEATLAPPREPEAEWRALLSELAEVSCDRYRAVVRGEAEFVEYFRYATPEVELGQLNIGSRPARRKKGGGIQSLRAIPWIFAWTQNRLCLPSWLGVGAALESSIEKGRLEQLRNMYGQWAFFRSTVDLIEMVVAKADIASAERYDTGLVPERLQPLGRELRGHLRTTIDTVLAISGHDELLGGYPEGRTSLSLRDPYIDPINLLQVELLRRLRQVPESAEPEQQSWHAFVVTVNGIAAGMRNTG